MGTDRSQVYNGQCPCGSGEIDIQFCTPDHPWPTNSKWFETKINCEKCDEIYSLEEQGKYYGLVEKREIIEREKRYEAYKAASEKLMDSQQSQSIINKFVALLYQQRSMAACHRILSGHGLVYESYGTFTKHWKGAASWVSSNVRADDLNKVLSVLGVQDEYISEAVLGLSKLWEGYKRPLPFHGEPLFNTSHSH